MSDSPQEQPKSPNLEPKIFALDVGEVTVPDPPEELEAARQKIKNRTAIMILELGSHTLVLGLALGSIWLIHLILEGLFGRDGKFFDYLPISWIIDAADLLVIGKFLWEIVKDFRRD